MATPIRKAARIRKAVFPVAGLGTRFLPATKTVPKEMLPIIDKPLIQYAVDEAIEAGCDTLVFVTNPLQACRRRLFRQGLRARTEARTRRQAGAAGTGAQRAARARARGVRDASRSPRPGHAVLCAKPWSATNPSPCCCPTT
jgi:UTP--glucose-1-phosphate uridylyltransferase